MTIRSFKNSSTEVIASGATPKGFPSDLARRAIRKLTMLDYAKELHDLRSPPGNHLEALKGDRAGQYSIRINDQWRICFRWVEGGAEDVEIVDYH
jgi:proteic killer suppression protein